jgi:tight adherence protein B
MNLANLVIAPTALRVGAVACAAVSTAGVSFILADDPQSLPRRYWSLYVAHLERKLRNMFIQTKGTPIAVAQLLLLFVVIGARLATGFPYWYLPLVLVIIAPEVYIERMRVERLRKMEKQVEPFILALANALKTTPSIGNALAVVHPLLEVPIQDEIGLVLKEVRVGSSLEQSLLNMSGRVRITELEATLSSILIGRQVGGNLPEILEATAATLREMARLAGVVRSKTASGRTQLVVLALAPLVVLLGFETVSPGYFNPLSESFIGWLIAGLAGILWVVALMLARKVLAVEL